MKNQILTHLNSPEKLERLYRSNKNTFKKDFDVLYPEVKGNSLAGFWNERLNYESDDLNWGICQRPWFCPDCLFDCRTNSKAPCNLWN